MLANFINRLLEHTLLKELILLRRYLAQKKFQNQRIQDSAIIKRIHAFKKKNVVATINPADAYFKLTMQRSIGRA